MRWKLSPGSDRWFGVWIGDRRSWRSGRYELLGEFGVGTSITTGVAEDMYMYDNIGDMEAWVCVLQVCCARPVETQGRTHLNRVKKAVAVAATMSRRQGV